MLAVSQSWHGHPGRLVANASEYRAERVAWGSPDNQGSNQSLPSWQAWAKPVGGGAVALLVVRLPSREGSHSSGKPDAPPRMGCYGPSRKSQLSRARGSCGGGRRLGYSNGTQFVSEFSSKARAVPAVGARGPRGRPPTLSASAEHARLAPWPSARGCRCACGRAAPTRRA